MADRGLSPVPIRSEESLLRPVSLAAVLAATTCLSCLASSGNAAQPMAKPNADMQAVLDAQASLHPKPIESLTPDEARKQPAPSDGVKIVMQKKGMNPNDPMGVATKDIMVDGGEGQIPARVYWPQGADMSKPLPVVLYFHGGGFVIATIDTYDASPRAIAKSANAVVISVEYRKAPEHKFPAAFDDAFAAYKWTLANAGSVHGDPHKVAVMGESAGGALALATSIKARDSHMPLPVREVLVYPVAGVDMNTPSYIENAKAKPLNKAMMGWFVKYLINSPADKMDPRLSGKVALNGLEPTTVILDQIDPLRSEGEGLRDHLKAAGVEVSAKTYEGVTHEFFGMGAVVPAAKDAEDMVANDLKGSFAK